MYYFLVRSTVIYPTCFQEPSALVFKVEMSSALTLKREKELFSVTLIPVYQTTRCHILLTQLFVLRKIYSACPAICRLSLLNLKLFISCISLSIHYKTKSMHKVTNIYKIIAPHFTTPTYFDTFVPFSGSPYNKIETF